MSAPGPCADCGADEPCEAVEVMAPDHPSGYFGTLWLCATCREEWAN